MKTDNETSVKETIQFGTKQEKIIPTQLKTYFSHDWTIINAVGNFNPHAD